MSLSPNDISRLLTDAVAPLDPVLPDIAPVLAAGHRRQRVRRLAAAGGATITAAIVTLTVIVSAPAKRAQLPAPLGRPSPVHRALPSAAPTAAPPPTRGEGPPVDPSAPYVALRPIDPRSSAPFPKSILGIWSSSGSLLESIVEPGPNDTLAMPVVSPSSRTVYFLRVRETLTRASVETVESVPIRGGTPSVLVSSDRTGDLSAMAVSPDGRRLALAGAATTRVITLDHSAAPETVRGVPDGDLVGWAPDGSDRLLWLTSSPGQASVQVVALPLDGSQPSVFVSTSAPTDGAPACGGDSAAGAVVSQFVYVVTGGCSARNPVMVRRFDAEGRAAGEVVVPQRYGTEYTAGQATVSSTGRLLFWLTHQDCQGLSPAVVVDGLTLAVVGPKDRFC